MTINELKDRIKSIIKEFKTDERNSEFTIFVYVSDDKNGDYFTFGLGCPACLTEQIVDLVEAEAFKHIRDLDKKEDDEDRSIH